MIFVIVTPLHPEASYVMFSPRMTRRKPLAERYPAPRFKDVTKE
jgi:hypothetical protein